MRWKPHLQSRSTADTAQVFDPVRRKWVALSPEELVRQLLIQYFIRELAFPAGRISVERQILVHEMQRRYDLVLWDKQANPLLLVECKAHTIPIAQQTLDQIARYNIALKVPYLLVTNGLESYCCKIDMEKGEYRFLDAMPELS